MHTENVVYIKAPAKRIFSLACDVGQWPRWLAHYRAVAVFEQSPDGSRKDVEMCAIREGFPVKGRAFPVKWRSVQVCDAAEGRIYFKHTGGIAQGMWVVWEIQSDEWGRGTRVSIAHDLTYPVDWLNGWFARDLVGRDFVHAIAGRTLATIKALAEAEAGTMREGTGQ